MAAPTKDRSNLVAATANQLRLIQIDFADETDEVRKGYLGEEVERVLATLVPEERTAFLEELKSRFPSWDRQAEPAPPEPEPAKEPSVAERRLRDPDFLIGRLAELMPSLPGPQKQALTERLSTMVPSASAGTGELGQTAQEMGITDTAQLNRVLQAFTMLVDFASALDPIIWNTWHQVAPRAKMGDAGQSGDLKHTLSEYAKPEKTVSSDQVKESINKLHNLIVALTSAISGAGRKFANRHLAKFSPLQIMTSADLERSGLLTAREVKYWRKYVELSEGVNEATIEKEIKESIANSVIELLTVKRDHS